MTGDTANTSCEEHLTLRSRMSELGRIPQWLDRLALQYAIPAGTRFAMNLCLEEVLFNIVVHGYAGNADGSLAIQYRMPQKGTFQFVVEDEAPPFNPLNFPVSPIDVANSGDRLGGHGIRLLRQFADSVEYEATAGGNRLTISFSASD